jgi:hypothetical protein
MDQDMVCIKSINTTQCLTLERLDISGGISEVVLHEATPLVAPLLEARGPPSGPTGLIKYTGRGDGPILIAPENLT